MTTDRRAFCLPALVPDLRLLTSMCWDPLPSWGNGSLAAASRNRAPNRLLYDNLNVKMPRFS
jgi:hypothetical protein